MAENKAKKMLQAKLICMELEDLFCIEKGCSHDCENCENNYAQGTRGEQEEALKVAIKSIEELEQYRSIGTVSECRKAVEKQMAKTPNIWGDGYADGQLIYDMYDCPNCGESYEIDYSDYDYCSKCGQHIDRTDLEKSEE